MGFFSFFAAPVLFATLDSESAGRLVRMVLPRYYLFGMIMGLLALAGVFGRVLIKQGKEIQWGSLVLILLMLALTFYSMLVLLSQVESARLAMRGATAPVGFATDAALTFSRLHRLSVALNLLTMLAGLTLVFIEGLRARSRAA